MAPPSDPSWALQAYKARGRQEQAQEEIRTPGVDLTHDTMRHFQYIIRREVSALGGETTIEILDVLNTGRSARLAKPPSSKSCRAEVTFSVQFRGGDWALLLADKKQGRVDWYHGWNTVFSSNSPTIERQHEWAQ